MGLEHEKFTWGKFFKHHVIDVAKKDWTSALEKYREDYELREETPFDLVWIGKKKAEGERGWYWDVKSLVERDGLADGCVVIAEDLPEHRDASFVKDFREYVAGGERFEVGVSLAFENTKDLCISFSESIVGIWQHLASPCSSRNTNNSIP